MRNAFSASGIESLLTHYICISYLLYIKMLIRKYYILPRRICARCDRIILLYYYLVYGAKALSRNFWLINETGYAKIKKANLKGRGMPQAHNPRSPRYCMDVKRLSSHCKREGRRVLPKKLIESGYLKKILL
jgi:hypothetical protein